MSGVLVSMAVLQVLTILAGLLRAKGLAMILGPAGFGVVSTIDQIVVTLVTMGGLALPFTAMRFMARGHSEGEAAFRRTGSAFLRLLTVLAVVMTALASVIVVAYPAMFGGDLVPWQRTLQVAVLGVPSAMLLILFVNILAAAQRPAAAAATNLLAVAGLAAAAVLGAWWRGPDGIYFFSVAVAILSTVAGFVFLSRTLGIRVYAAERGLLDALRTEPEILTNAACFYAMMCASSVTLLVVRTVVLSHLGAVAAGQLQAAFSIALTVGAVLLPLSNLYLAPLVNRTVPAAEKRAAAHDFAARMLVLLLIGALPVVLFPGMLLRALFSPEFISAAAVLWLFVLWQCAFQMVYVYQQLLVGLDDVVFAAGLSVLGFAVAMAVSVPLVQWGGLAGVALALVAGMLLNGGGLLLRLNLRHGDWIPARVAVRFAGVIAGVVAAGLLFAGRPEYGPGARLPRFALAAAILLAFWLMLNREERDPRLWIAAARRGRGATTAS